MFPPRTPWWKVFVFLSLVSLHFRENQGDIRHLLALVHHLQAPSCCQDTPLVMLGTTKPNTDEATLVSTRAFLTNSQNFSPSRPQRRLSSVSQGCENLNAYLPLARKCTAVNDGVQGSALLTLWFSQINYMLFHLLINCLHNTHCLSSWPWIQPPQKKAEKLDMKKPGNCTYLIKRKTNLSPPVSFISILLESNSSIHPLSGVKSLLLYYKE